MSDPHSADESGTPDPLLESVSLLSRKWHPVVIPTLSGSDGLGYSDLKRKLDGIIDSLADWSETYLTEPETEQVVLIADDIDAVAPERLEALSITRYQ